MPDRSTMNNRRPARLLCALAALTLMLALAGCSDPYASMSSSTPATGVQNAGEPSAPGPSANGEHSTRLQATPQRALTQFGVLYTNWTWRTLARDQQTLEAMSVGAARLAEQQAAAATRADSTLARARLANHGELLAIAPDMTRSGWWILITREQTSGNGEYEALPASDHVTLAQVAHLDRGWAVSQWLPQN